ncbi:MAG: hypothetical protein J6N78_00890 [Clostridia bacterium]|nr:hypothetical protein [Clostridia bacterium]
MALFTGLIRCSNNHAYKGRKERNNINYRCNCRLKYGKDRCNNDNMVEETYLIDMITQQLAVINMEIKNVDIRSIVDKIEVSPARIEIFYKNLPISSSYYDAKLGKLHYDSETN